MLACGVKSAFPQAGFGFSGVKQFKYESTFESALTLPPPSVSFGF
jgi:hypothetical protein